MNTKLFSEAMNEVNDRYYEEAANYQAKKKKNGWLKWGVVAACLSLVVAIGIPTFDYLTNMQDEVPSEDFHSNPGTSNNLFTPDIDEIFYRGISFDWPFYENAQDLVDNSTLIVLANVTGISFQILDTRTAQPATDETEEINRSIYTMYEIDVIKQYKGDPLNDTQVRVMGGLKDIYLEEQLLVLGEDIKNGIPIVEGTPEICIGETYLFVLYQYEDTAPTLVNLEQSVFHADGSESIDQFASISVKDIMLCFGKDEWEEFQRIGEMK